MIAPLPDARQTRRVPALGLLLLAALLFGPGATAAQAQDLNARVNRLQQELQTLQRAVYGGQAGGGATTAGATRPQAARLELRLSQLENQIRSLTGQVEEMTFRVNSVSKRLDSFIAQVEHRLLSWERGAPAMTGAETPTGGGGEFAAGTGAPGRQRSLGALPQSSGGGEAARPSVYDSGPKVIGAVPASNLETLRQQAAGGGSDQPGIATTSPPQQAALPATPRFPTAQAQYDHAFGLLSQANYPAAEQALSAFLDRYPDDPLAGNAMYWLGETHYVRGQYREAAVTFAEGYQQYPKSNKAPDNLLKLGKSLSALGQKEDACGTLAELLSRYGDAAANVIQQAKRERQRLGCP